MLVRIGETRQWMVHVKPWQSYSSSSLVPPGLAGADRRSALLSSITVLYLAHYKASLTIDCRFDQSSGTTAALRSVADLDRVASMLFP